MVRTILLFYVFMSLYVCSGLDKPSVEKVSFWFYEYYSSQYRRSFLEMSYKWCNLVYKDTFFGPALRKNLPKSCPHKPGDYHLYNMTASMGGIPQLPFTSGRMYANGTVNHDIIFSAYIDVEFRRKIIPST